MNKFNKYVNHLNNLVLDGHNIIGCRHTMNRETMIKVFKDFYDSYPDFFVYDNNELMSVLNADYNIFEKWIVDD